MKRTVLLVLCLVLHGCDADPVGADGGTEGGVDAATSPPDSEPIVREMVGAEGGEILVRDTGTLLDGMRVVVPAGALEEDLEFTIGIAKADGVDEVREPPDLALDALELLGDEDDAVHPLAGPFLFGTAEHEALGPALDLGPTGATFAEPIEVRFPADGTAFDPEGALFMSAALAGSLVDGSIVGDRIPTRFDPATGELVAEVSHFSVLQFLGAAATGPGRLLIAGYRSIVRSVSSVPDVQEFGPAFVGALLCETEPLPTPRVYPENLPNPLALIGYLSTPVAPREGESREDFIQLLENLDLMSGHERVVEDWVIMQPAGSVTLDQLFLESYRQNGGDVYGALLTSHNVLRGFDGHNRRGSGDRGGPIQDAMAPLTGGARQEVDEAGDRYHVVGVALLALVSRTHSRNRLTLLNYAADGLASSIVSTTGIYFEECLVSRDCLSDNIEFAYDLRGRELGFELANNLIGSLNSSDDPLPRTGTILGGPTLEELARLDRYAASCDLDAAIVADMDLSAPLPFGETMHLSVETVGTVALTNIEWQLGGEVISTEGEFDYLINNLGEHVLSVTVTDAAGRELMLDTPVVVAFARDAMHDFCPTAMPGTGGAVYPLESASVRVGPAPTGTCGYRDPVSRSSSEFRIGYTASGGGGRFQSPACWTDQPTPTNARCSTSDREAAVTINTADDGFADDAERSFAELVLAWAESRALSCVPHVPSTDPCGVTTFNCPARFRDGRELQLVTADLCPVQSSGTLTANCDYQLIDCATDSVDTEAYNERFSVSWTETGTGGPFACSETTGSNPFESGTYNARVWISTQPPAALTSEQIAFGRSLRDTVVGGRATPCAP